MSAPSPHSDVSSAGPDLFLKPRAQALGNPSRSGSLRRFRSWEPTCSFVQGVMNDWRNPDDLQAVEARLRAGRAQLTPIELDQLKNRLTARDRARPRRVIVMKSRIAAVLTALTLGIGTTGAVAVAGIGSFSGSKGGAADTQYRPGKGCGDGNHDHSGSGSCPTPPGKGHDEHGAGDHGQGQGDRGNSHGDHGHGDHGGGNGRH
jgi:hypothetical protein